MTGWQLGRHPFEAPVVKINLPSEYPSVIARLWNGWINRLIIPSDIKGVSDEGFDMKRLWAFLRDEDGAVSIEYAMIGAGLSILIISGATSIGSSINSLFLGPVATALSPAPPASP